MNFLTKDVEQPVKIKIINHNVSEFPSIFKNVINSNTEIDV